MANKKSNVDRAVDAVEPVVNPLWQSASVATNDAGPRIEDVSPVFAQADAVDFARAADALEEDGEHPTNVILPEDDGKRTNEEAVASVKAAAKDALKVAKDGDAGSLPETTDEAAERDDNAAAAVVSETDSKTKASAKNAEGDATKAEQAKRSSGNKAS